MNPSEAFIRRPVATALLTLALLLLGALGYRALPVASLPSVDFPTLQVTAAMSGASPEVMAATVTLPLEQQLGRINGLTAMSSVSLHGHTTITLQFALSHSIDTAVQDVQAALNAARSLLPRQLTDQPAYSKVNPADTPILMLAVTSDTVPATAMADFVRTVLSQKLAMVDGVGLVSIEGSRKPAIRIQLDPAAVAAVGLDLEDVRTAIAAASVNVPKGDVQGRRLAYTLAVNDQLESADAYRSLAIAWRNGAPIRLSDLGTVEAGVENARAAAWVDGKPAILLNVQRQPGSNIVATVERIHDRLPDLRTAAPAGVRIDVVADRTALIQSAIRDVQMTLAVSVGLVVLVIALFLRRLWATVIPSVTLPLSLVAAFAVMQPAGFSLNNLSLMALTVAAGFVVDDAIVMIENIVRHMEDGEPPLAAAIKGARQINFTVIALTVSLVSVFIPLLFMGGVVGRLFREFALTLTFAVLISAVVSLTLTPMMCAHLLRRPPPAGADGRAPLGWLGTAYAAGLDWALAHPRMMLAVTAGAAALTVALFATAPKSLLPVQDSGLLLGVTDVAEDASFATLAERQQALADLVRKDPAVTRVGSYVGATGMVGNSGALLIVLAPRDQRRDSPEAILHRLRALAAARPDIGLFLQPVQDVQVDSRSARSQYQLTLQSVSNPVLDQWAPRLAAALREQPELQDVASDQRSAGLRLALTVDRDSAARLGVSPQAIDAALYDAFGERPVATIYTHLNQYRVVMEAAPQRRAAPVDIEAVHVRSTTESLVPLGAFVTSTVSTAPLALSRINQFPATTLSFNLAPGASLDRALAAIARASDAIGLPESITVTLSGTAAEFQRLLADQPVLILAVLVTLYIVLGILYESMIHPITILSTLPSAGVGALVALRLLGEDLTIIALIGLVLLIGIAKKNAIMMIDFAVDAERREGLDPGSAIRRACLQRFRPIMMTTMAALLGALPLALDGGAGAELRRPLGVVLIGGLLVSQVLTLFSTPVVHLWVRRLAEPRRGAASAARSAASPAAGPGH